LSQINNAEPPVSEAASNTALMAQIDAGVVRSPMDEQARHPPQEVFLDRRTGKIKFSTDAAH